ncbi:Cellobiose 2-epimerase [Flavobacterium sp. 9AF]|uniref:AGE family epimerase/isomerase n=1 Tax=Flavobacterium sp. 9AF TaxID=2653142 RepID=UPI0012F2C38A|nr:AGE family epimerase/isomerase [Flavobacterium sp. 9AF]VXB57524.1 Cellobiose 2-epimerase [Flavobacterium sp. 9AF]
MASNHQWLKSVAQDELRALLYYWENNSIDDKNGGFIGQIDSNEVKRYDSEKGVVLNARILWTFSAVYTITNDPNHLLLAESAFHYIDTHFVDTVNGGVFWSIYPNGKPKDTKKQIYALAFTIYGLSEYYKISKNEAVLQLAINLYENIERYSYDHKNNGYFEAFTKDWQPIEDLRLSEKDANEKKTMNTHLHIVEAYANLYEVWPNTDLKGKITNLLLIIETYFIDLKTFHLKLFFDENWIEKPDVISYGHDIEAAWLLYWCATRIDDRNLINKYKIYAIAMANATKEGLDKDGGLWYEYNPKDDVLIAEKHWWPQAELWIGMVNAWQLTHDESYLAIVEKNVTFFQNHIKDKKYGEWFWGVTSDYSKIEKDKVGFWKCPYHNGRACIELLKRL